VDSVPAIDLAPGDDSVHIAWWALQSLGADGRWRTTIKPGHERRIALSAIGDVGGKQVAVTAVDRAGQASGLTIIGLP
jgi:hypothetical protein